MSNRAAVLVRAGEIALEQRPVPTAGPRDVLVEVTSVGVCGSDVHWYRHGRIGDLVVEAPLVLGHECAGDGSSPSAPKPRSTAVGRSRVASSLASRAVAVASAGPAGTTCAPTFSFFATPPIDGAFADSWTIHEDSPSPFPRRHVG